LEAKLIKISDKICNIRDVTFRPPPNWPLERRIAYLDWAERVVNGLGACNGALEALFRETLSLCRAELRPDLFAG
jgi:guanosine-3',5'-bis(diphosphate) 3'-pyrophosphohydrolase